MIGQASIRRAPFGQGASFYSSDQSGVTGRGTTAAMGRTADPFMGVQLPPPTPSILLFPCLPFIPGPCAIPRPANPLRRSRQDRRHRAAWHRTEARAVIRQRRLRDHGTVLRHPGHHEKTVKVRCTTHLSRWRSARLLSDPRMRPIPPVLPSGGILKGRPEPVVLHDQRSHGRGREVNRFEGIWRGISRPPPDPPRSRTGCRA